MLESRWAYTAMMILATLVTGLLIRRTTGGTANRAISVTPTQRMGILIGGLAGAMFAAKIPFVLSAETPDGVISAWLGDGKTILWGLAGGYVGVEVGKWATWVHGSTGDQFVVALAVGIAVGRIGCLMFGCCYGVETDLPWGLCFTTSADLGTVPRHPTQIYEMIFHLTFAAIAWRGIQRGVIPTCWMPLYLVAYSVYRFASEFVRPEPRMAAGLTFYQWSAIVIVTVFFVILVRRLRRSPRAPAPQPQAPAPSPPTQNSN